ncbi:MAG: alpha-glucosidase [Erysipelotrichaceae bacterium]|nr:alpha-glucosidase [Erysipelotrichaceae bacterium]
MEITRKSSLKEVMKSASGHDIIARLLYSLGLDEDLVTSGPLSHIKVGALQKLSLGKLTEESVDALLELLNSLNDDEGDETAEVREAWWKEAVFYEVYPRSFCDSDHDGIGDIRGIISKLDHIRSLGVDAIWCCPFYDSPNADNGYDIRDYKGIMKEFGTMKDVEDLIEECHKRDMKIIVDLVMNHTSDEHEWFQKALQGDEKYKNYYIWKKEPNNWTSLFAGKAWRYFPEVGEYALHLFADKQMDLNWDNPEVRKEMHDVANFWLEKGVDGFRLDVVSFISKKEGLPDGDPMIGSLISFTGVEHYFHGPHLDEYLREFNKVCLEPHQAYTIGECPGNGIRMSRMITGDDRGELTQLFSFDHIENPGKTRMKDAYDFDLRQMIPELVRWQTQYSNHCWPSLFFDNHDNPRMCSKVDRSDTYSKQLNKLLMVLLMTMKGTPYLYQGGEIGMTDYPFTSIEECRDVETLNIYKEYKAAGAKDEEILKKILYGSRDHARTPMQWNDSAYAGFSDHEPWIAVNPNYKTLNVEAEEKDEESVLNFTRKIISLRKKEKALIYGSFTQLKTSKDLFCYEREKDGKKFTVVINLTDKKKKRPFPVKGRRVLSNYQESGEELQPYEADVFEVE